jgi:hypothetical protein
MSLEKLHQVADLLEALRAELEAEQSLANEPENKYAPGRLHLLIFDRLGALDRSVALTTKNLVGAKELATAVVSPDESFVLLRVLYNSRSHDNE